MKITFASSITAEELVALPSGTVISFGKFCWEKLGGLWLYHNKNEYTADDLYPAADSKRASMEIHAKMSLYRDLFPQFCVIKPFDDDAFGFVMWSVEDIANAYDKLGYKMTAEKVATVRNKVAPIIDEKMIEQGWNVLYGAIEEVERDHSE